MSESCVFCDRSWMRAAEVFIETPAAYSPRPATRTSGPMAVGAPVLIGPQMSDNPDKMDSLRREIMIVDR